MWSIFPLCLSYHSIDRTSEQHLLSHVVKAEETKYHKLWVAVYHLLVANLLNLKTSFRMRRIIGRPYLTVCRCPAAECLGGRTPRCSHPPSQELWEGVKGEDVQEVTDLCNYTDLSQPRTVSTLCAMVRTVRSARQDWITWKIVV